MKFGCCIANIEDLAKVEKCGYDFFEFSAAKIGQMSEKEFGELVEIKEKLNIPCIGFNSYSSGKPAIVGYEFSEYETETYAKMIADRGKDLGIRGIGIGAPKARVLPVGYAKELARAQLNSFLQITGNIAANQGIDIYLEAVHAGLCNYINYTKEAVDVVKESSICNLFIVLDFYHMEVMQETLDSVDLAAPYLKHTHISTNGQNLFRDFPDKTEKEKYSNIIKKLYSVGYNETMSIEPSQFQEERAVICLEMLKELA